jgi:hypothetical protein
MYRPTGVTGDMPDGKAAALLLHQTRDDSAAAVFTWFSLHTIEKRLRSMRLADAKKVPR